MTAIPAEVRDSDRQADSKNIYSGKLSAPSCNDEDNDNNDDDDGAKTNNPQDTLAARRAR